MSLPTQAEWVSSSLGAMPPRDLMRGLAVGADETEDAASGQTQKPTRGSWLGCSFPRGFQGMATLHGAAQASCPDACSTSRAAGGQHLTDQRQERHSEQVLAVAA